jgi:hypothetical protein
MTPTERLLAEQATQARIDAAAAARRELLLNIFQTATDEARDAPDYEVEVAYLRDAIEAAAELLGVTVELGA